MALKVTLLQKALDDLDRLSLDVRSRILKRIRWLGENATVIVHHRLSSLPLDLAGLCRMRVGDYRVLYWLARRRIGDDHDLSGCPPKHGLWDSLTSTL